MLAELVVLFEVGSIGPLLAGYSHQSISSFSRQVGDVTAGTQIIRNYKGRAPNSIRRILSFAKRFGGFNVVFSKYYAALKLKLSQPSINNETYLVVVYADLFVLDIVVIRLLTDRAN